MSFAATRLGYAFAEIFAKCRHSCQPDALDLILLVFLGRVQWVWVIDVRRPIYMRIDMDTDTTTTTAYTTLPLPLPPCLHANLSQ